MKFIKIEDLKIEMQECPVTQEEWFTVMNTNPSYFKDRSDHPVESVSWNDVKEFIKTLNESNKKYIYRLPSEKEWEFCCRAGSDKNYCFGDDESKLKDYAWCYENSNSSTQPVKKKKPNKFGLYDMHGNVWEWCEDLYSNSCSYRVVRGGGWGSDPSSLRSAWRGSVGPGGRDDDVGFRLVRTVSLDPVTLLHSKAEQALAVAKAALIEIEKILK